MVLLMHQQHSYRTVTLEMKMATCKQLPQAPAYQLELTHEEAIALRSLVGKGKANEQPLSGIFLALLDAEVPREEFTMSDYNRPQQNIGTYTFRRTR
jgi:hypothetical protein